MRRTHTLLALLVWLSVGSASPARAEGVVPELRILALTGGLAPGTPIATRFAKFPSVPLIDASGRIAFDARIDNPPQVFGRDAIWRTTAAGDLEFAVGSAGHIPGILGLRRENTTLAGFRGGRILATSEVSPPFGIGNDHALWLTNATSGALALVADAKPPGTMPGVSVEEFIRPALTEVGQVAFAARLRGLVNPFNRDAIWGPDPSGALALLARTNEPALDSPGFRFTRTGSAVQLNRFGEVAFWGRLSLFALDAVFGPDAAGALRRRALELDPAPGAPPGSTFTAILDDVGLTDAGDLLFLAEFETGNGIWQSSHTGEVTPRVIAGPDTEPLPSGIHIDEISDFAVNSTGTLAFTAKASPGLGDGESVWRADAEGGLELLAMRGQPVPGRPGLEYGFPVAADINERGDVLIRSSESNGVFEDHFFVLAPRDADPVVIAVIGDFIEILPGVQRMLQEITLADEEGATRRAFDEHGRVVFHARFPGSEAAIIVADVGIEDTDQDGTPDLLDNCPADPNPDQADLDGNGIGDACNSFEDMDGDDHADDLDVCPSVADPDQPDTDGDGIGDVCNAAIDFDGDDHRDDLDNCPETSNRGQSDRDSDGQGDACDPFPDEPDNEKGQLRFDLGASTEALNVCLDRRPFEDADGDGEEDSTDACAATPAGEAVDDAGCSLTQFCGARSTRGRGGRDCTRADWQADETSPSKPHDCMLDGRGKKAQCVPATDPSKKGPPKRRG